ncbi:MAG TPA: hypothetical protein VGK35_06750, partial [Actinotalea sp.]
AGSLMLQHSAVTLVALTGGAVLGAGLSWAVGPLLVLSSTGKAPVPSPLVQWPWPLESAALAALLLGCLATAAPVTLSLVRRATVAHLRMDAP